MPPPSEDPLVGLEVRITDEKVGPKSFGKIGTLSSIKEHMATIFTASGTISCDRSYIEEERAEWKKPEQHKQFNHMSRARMQKILEAMACFPQPFVEYSLEMQPIAADGYLEDEHLVAAWEWMRFSLKIPDEVQMLDPALVARLSTTLTSEDEETFQHLQASILSFASGVEMLLCPIQGHSPAHWTLLVKDSSSWRYYETLATLHTECHQRAVALISLLDSVDKDQVQLQRCNHIKQKDADCGLFVIAYMEQEACRSTSGPASRGWPDNLQSDWKIKLQKLQKGLQAEFGKLIKAKHELENQAESLKKKQEFAHNKASERLKKLKDHKSAAALDAIANMTKNSQFFRVKDLSDHAVYQIQRAEEKLTRCGSCRYQTGCLRCDAAKALSYHIRNEAQKANKVPKWEGPGLKGMVIFSACFFLNFWC